MKPIIAIPATIALIVRARSKNSLTLAGQIAATLTAIAHAYHPWNLPFALLCVFFLAGTRATHVKEDIKAKLTLHSKGSSGGEGPRTHIQVLANSLVASILSIAHGYQLRSRQAALADQNAPAPVGTLCYSWGGDLLVIGIIANYAAVAADTFSSELGILSKGEPRLITSWNLRKVPRGTNGGVSLVGLVAGLFGSMIIVTATVLLLPMCSEATEDTPGGGRPWLTSERRVFMGGMVIWGLLGSVLDSILGGLFQQSVKDVRSGKIVEGEGGLRVLASTGSDESSARAAAREAVSKEAGAKSSKKAQAVTVEDDDEDETVDKYSAKNKHRKPSFGDERPSRVVENGWDLLDNNDVNFLMAVIMSVGGMAGASWYWGIPIQDALVV
ncbi:unnamed protein product [Clonostachys byssicola]|uniref:Transmembrane protein 19 n=1 Tax=Clonostachys byssicola TaxID=160290 RepID=A0A9N9UVB5_9HYPO|nr:unnamed protein product [Clonostachys byssicola]